MHSPHTFSLCKDGHGQTDVWEHRVDLNVASADRISGLILRNAETGVTFLSPASAIGGAHHPVSITGIRLRRGLINVTIAYDSHKFVDLNIFVDGCRAVTVSLREDSRLIELKALGSIDGYGQWLHSNESLSNIHVKH